MREHLGPLLSLPAGLRRMSGRLASEPATLLLEHRRATHRVSGGLR